MNSFRVAANVCVVFGIALCCVWFFGMVNDSFAEPSSGGSGGGGGGGGTASATELVYKDGSGNLVGSATLTYNGTTLFSDKFQSADDDGGNAYVARNNSAGAGGYGTATTGTNVALFVENDEGRFRSQSNTGSSQLLVLEGDAATVNRLTTIDVPEVLTAADMKGSMNIWDCIEDDGSQTGECTFKLPSAVIGYHARFFTLGDRNVVLYRLDLDDSDHFIIKKAIMSDGNSIKPSGAQEYGHGLEVMAISTSEWVVYEIGPWEDNGS